MYPIAELIIILALKQYRNQTRGTNSESAADFASTFAPKSTERKAGKKLKEVDEKSTERKAGKKLKEKLKEVDDILSEGDIGASYEWKKYSRYEPKPKLYPCVNCDRHFLGFGGIDDHQSEHFKGKEKLQVTSCTKCFNWYKIAGKDKGIHKCPIN